MSVTMNVFSGIHDPSWTVSPEMERAFASALEKMPKASAECRLPEALGYRSVTLEFDRPVAGSRRWTIGGGWAKADEDCLVDLQQALERSVLRSGAGKYDPVILPGPLRRD